MSSLLYCYQLSFVHQTLCLVGFIVTSFLFVYQTLCLVGVIVTNCVCVSNVMYSGLYCDMFSSNVRFDRVMCIAIVVLGEAIYTHSENEDGNPNSPAFLKISASMNI